LGGKELPDIASLDAVGPFPVTENGSRRLLIFLNHFTRYSSEFRQKLLTHREASFTSAFVSDVSSLLRIQRLQIRVSSYSAQTNEICERMHKFIIDIILHFVNKTAQIWVRYIA
jgi:hypothetical protein